MIFVHWFIIFTDIRAGDNNNNACISVPCRDDQYILTAWLPIACQNKLSGSILKEVTPMKITSKMGSGQRRFS